MSVDGLVYLRQPAASDRSEFISLMRASRSFHRPWATAPTDDDRFAAYLADARRPDFEAMLVCRREDDAIVGFSTSPRSPADRCRAPTSGTRPGSRTPATAT